MDPYLIGVGIALIRNIRGWLKATTYQDYKRDLGRFFASILVFMVVWWLLTMNVSIQTIEVILFSGAFSWIGTDILEDIFRYVKSRV